MYVTKEKQSPVILGESCEFGGFLGLVWTGDLLVAGCEKTCFVPCSIATEQGRVNKMFGLQICS